GTGGRVRGRRRRHFEGWLEHFGHVCLFVCLFVSTFERSCSHARWRRKWLCLSRVHHGRCVSEQSASWEVRV
ncbi:hypothetical protein AAFF_G00367840, partial [Aldrovandia affinis]